MEQAVADPDEPLGRRRRDDHLAGRSAIDPAQLTRRPSIDGASAWRRFRHITLPMLSPYILFNAIVGLIGTMQIFAEAYIMTTGGPADSTLFYAYYLFTQRVPIFPHGLRQRAGVDPVRDRADADADPTVGEPKVGAL